MVHDIIVYQVMRIKNGQCYEGTLYESTLYEGTLYELRGNKGFHKKGAAEGRLLYFLGIHTEYLPAPCDRVCGTF